MSMVVYIFILKIKISTGSLQMIVPSQLTLTTHTNFRCAACFVTLDKLVNRFPLPPDASLPHVIKLAAHSI
jgi:hypothetical protein